MRENISTVSTKVIQLGLVIIVFFIPIFFLPTTSEFYNFNKTTLLIAATLFLFFVWGVKMTAEQRVRITRTPLDVPLLIFLIVYILATVFSIDQVVSILGWHPVFFNSLPSIIALVALYFLATSHLNSTYRQAVYSAFVTSAIILTIVAIVYYFGHTFLNAPWAQTRNWTPAGDLDKLVSFLTISIPLSLGLALLVKETAARYVLFILAALQITAFVLINSLFGYLVLGTALLYVILFLPKLSFPSEDKIIFGVLAVIGILLLLVVNVPGAGDGVLKPLISGDDKSISIAKPVRLPLTASWQTAAQSLANRPLFGSGPSTFGLIYPSFKPISVNTINENNLWNIRFDESGSGLMTILATTGAVGIIAFLLFATTLIKNLISFSVRSSTTRNNSWFIFLQASLVGGIIGLVFFNLNNLNMVPIIVLAAAFFSTLRDWGATSASEVDLQLVALRKGALRAIDSEKGAQSNALSWLLFIVAVLIFGGTLFYLWRTYAAEFYYQKAILASQNNQGRETRDNLVAAIKANPYRDTYHRALLATDLALARALNQKGNLNQDEQNTLIALVREAVDQGRIITGYEGRGLGSFQIKKVAGTSVFNVANWESIATVYANIGGELRADASTHAINTFTQATKLEPTNPRLYDALGSVYFGIGDLDNAIKNYELAISAKQDYVFAHYNLAQAVRRKGDNPARVVNELSATLQLLKENEEQNKAQIERVEKELDEARKVLEKSQQQQQKQQRLQLQTSQPTPAASPSATPSR